MGKPYYEQNGITIYHGDARDVLPSLNGVDLVIADPPYSLTMASSMKTAGWGDLMNSAYFYGFILKQAKRLTVNAQGAAWVFNNWCGLPVLQKASYEEEWPIESVLVWDKQWIGPGGQRGLRPSYELVALFCHDDFQIADRGVPDIWQSPFSSHKPNGHPAEKPLALIKRIILESNPRTVLDPFLGSGTTLVAAHELGRAAVGIEIEERWCELAANRLSQDVMALV